MTTLEPVHGFAPTRPNRALAWVAAALIATFAITTVPGVRASPAFHTVFDGWLQSTAYVAVAVVAVVRPRRSPVDRLLWGLIAVAVGLRALGFVLFLGYVRLQHPLPYPNVADYAWLTMDAVLLLAFWVLLRRRIRYRSVGLLLDAALMGLTVAGVAVVLLFHTLDTISGSDAPDGVVVVNLAYPLLDIGMLVLVSGALVTTGIRSWSTVLLAAGVVVISVVDA
jgi:hypothetical protein